MGITFHAGAFFVAKQKRREQFMLLYHECLNRGFEYFTNPLNSDHNEGKFIDHLELLSQNKENSFWVQNNLGELLLSIGYQAKDFGFSEDENMRLFHFLFNNYFINTGDSLKDQQFLEETISMLTGIYTLFNAELAWAGYDPSIPSAQEYSSGNLIGLRWFNVLSLRFVNVLGREKLLNAPGWQIKELPNGSVVVRLSEHPHVYERINGVYLHEYLGLEYVS